MYLRIYAYCMRKCVYIGKIMIYEFSFETCSGFICRDVCKLNNSIMADCGTNDDLENIQNGFLAMSLAYDGCNRHA